MTELYLKIKKVEKIIVDLVANDPDFLLWKSILSQILYIVSDFDGFGICKKLADIEDVKKIILGLQAVREIESGNPDFADLLCDMDYEYKSIYGVS